MVPSEKNFYEYLMEYLEKSPDRNFIGDENGWLTVRETWERVRCTGLALHQSGIDAGDYVALRTTRCVDSVILFLALQRIGAVAVLTDPHNKADEFLQEHGPGIPVKAVLTNEEAGMDLTCGGNWIYTDKTSGEKQGIDPACRETSLQEWDVPEREACAPSIIIFTSGSTGGSKAVILSQYNCVNNLVDSEPLGWYCQEDIALGMVPLHHVFGLALLTGAIVLQYGLFLPLRTEVPDLLNCIERYGITRVNAVPSLYLAMAQLRDNYDLHTLRAGFIGGAPCTPEQFIRIEETLDMTLIPVYGMSECIGISCASWQDSREQRIGGVGRIYSMNTVRIVDEEGRDVPAGQEGEIWVNGPARMVGYFGEDRGLDEEGFLHTGDLGYLDEEEILHISGRKKDIIIRNGINISARRIEEALLKLPEVQDSCVVGVPHPRQGEVPCIQLVLAQGEGEGLIAGARLQELLARTSLAKNEWPAYAASVASIPVTSSGKQDKQTIKNIFMREVFHG